MGEVSRTREHQSKENREMYIEAPDAAAVKLEVPVTGHLGSLDIPDHESPVRVGSHDLHLCCAHIIDTEPHYGREDSLAPS